MVEVERIVTSGKRKTAIARAVLVSGSGKVTVNKIDHSHLSTFDRLRILEPLKIAEAILGKIDFDVAINVRGGGNKGQIEAARLSLAKVIIKHAGSNAKAKSSNKSEAKELEKAYLEYDRNLLVADVRRKEAYKPDDSRARGKRQTSYR